MTSLALLLTTGAQQVSEEVGLQEGVLEESGRE